jgi:hypothetical protein
MKKFLVFLFYFLFLGLGHSHAEEAWNLEEVVVTATKTPHLLKDVPVETVVVTKEDIEKTKKADMQAHINKPINKPIHRPNRPNRPIHGKPHHGHHGHYGHWHNYHPSYGAYWPWFWGSAIVTGAFVSTIPDDGCIDVYIDDKLYKECDGVLFEPVYQDDEITYKVVEIKK